MRKNAFIFLLSCFTYMLILLSCENKPTETSAAADSTQQASESRAGASSLSRAAEGDTIWIFVNHVKADKREQFEKFVHEIFWDSASKLSEPEQRVFRQTRVLHPTQPEKDGTFSYVFMMDPVIPGGNYDIEKLTKQIYGDEKAKEHLKMFDETNAREQTGYFLIQSRH